MDNNKKLLSEYIDSLNAEEKPRQHKNPTASPELENLMKTVRMVRSLKEESLPDEGYAKKLAFTVAGRLSQKEKAGRLSQKVQSKKPKRRWVFAIASVAALVFMAVLLNFILPFGSGNIVYAMEQAFQEVKAYHGILEIVQSNEEGKDTIQAKLEVWADKDGHYHVRELYGEQKGLITVNNGREKWQLRPAEKQVYMLPAFPDSYRFIFELGKEIDNIKNALETKVAGEEEISGRKAVILEVTPSGGLPYRIWIDKETRLPLQKQSAMQNSLQYRVTYTEIDFADAVPAELVDFNIPEGFRKIDTNPEQLVNSAEEAWAAAGFAPKVPENIPEGYVKSSMAVATDTKTIRLYFTAQDKQKNVVVMQKIAEDGLNPASTAVLGKVGGITAEIRLTVEGNSGILAGGGSYAGMTDISSIRWQQDGFEYAVVGNALLEELAVFVKSMAGEELQIPEDVVKTDRPGVEVPVDLEVEKNEQKSADAGHSAWKLDPAYVSQVFVSLMISPEGIQGEYPIRYEDLKISQNNGKEAIVEVSGDKTPVGRVYLKKLVRQDDTGIWTVVGYDPSTEK